MAKKLCCDGRAHRFGQIKVRQKDRYGNATENWTFRKRQIVTDTLIDGGQYKTEKFSEEMFARLFCKGCGATKTILAVPASLKKEE